MILEILQEDPAFVTLQTEKAEKDELESTYEAVKKALNEKGNAYYTSLQEALLKEVERKRSRCMGKDSHGVELARELCKYDVHPWAKRTKYTAQCVYKGDKYYNTNHKRIPKLYVEHCPVCGKILCTQQRIYRLGKREIVDIPLDLFEKRAKEFGYKPGSLEVYVDFLPIFSCSNRKFKMNQILEELKPGQPKEVADIIQSILDYWSGNDQRNRKQSEEYQKALDNASELCKIFGHDVRGIEARCKCCGRRMTREQLLADYHSAVLSGVVDFPYLHETQLVLENEPSEDALRDILLQLE